jgi:quercetin dioxygenase-like cupin family protein
MPVSTTVDEDPRVSHGLVYVHLGLDARAEARHPAGDEVVVVLCGHQTLIQEIDGEQRRIDLHAGHAVINPRGVWHTADVHEPGSALFITPGQGTEHRPR